MSNEVIFFLCLGGLTIAVFIVCAIGIYTGNKQRREQEEFEKMRMEGRKLYPIPKELRQSDVEIPIEEVDFKRINFDL